MDKFNNKYRIESNRMPGWDYSRNGYYYVTPVIRSMKCLLGKIENGKMIFSDFGKIVHDEWHKSFEIRQELFLDEYIIMLNHLHAILIIKHPKDDIGNNSGNDAGNDDGNEIGNDDGDDDWNVQTHGRVSLSSPNAQSPNAQSPNAQSPNAHLHRPPKSISSFMAGFKSATTSKIDDYIDLHHLSIKKFNQKNRLWQINYHDHIIRNDFDYQRIKKYIRNNLNNWDEDKLRTKR